MVKITQELLENAEPGTVLATGTFVDWGDTDICTTGKTLRWVAIRGTIHDWAIYHQPCYYDEYSSDKSWSEWSIRATWDKFPKSLTYNLKDIEMDKFAYMFYRG